MTLFGDVDVDDQHALDLVKGPIADEVTEAPAIIVWWTNEMLLLR